MPAPELDRGSSGMSERSGAKPIAGPAAPPTPPRPSTNGSSMMPRNWLINWNAPCCAPVAASPGSSVSARKVRASEIEQAEEAEWQRAAIVEEGVYRIGDGLLVLIEAPHLLGSTKARIEVQQHISRRIAETDRKAGE